MYFIAACLPVLRPLVLKVLSSRLVSTMQRTQQRSGIHSQALPLNAVPSTRISHGFLKLPKTPEIDDDDDTQHRITEGGSVGDSELGSQVPHPVAAIGSDISTARDRLR